ncbi:MAG TPA: UvrD-helicase domain-containing protein, partial [Pirellulales bacterium]
MAAEVRIVAGPARSGKTAALLAGYRRVICGRSAEHALGREVSQSIGAGLWLSPTRHAASDVRRRLITGGLRGCFSPAVYTLEQFAETILAKAERIEFLGRSLKRQLIQRLIAEAKSQKQLRYFAPIAETDGLVELVAEFISDLKRHEISPERFSELAATGASEKNRELAGLYEKYQGVLDAHQWFDAEQRFQLAADRLQRLEPAQWGELANLRLVIVDGFTDFTAAQYRMIDALMKRAAKLKQFVVTLPLEKKTKRDDLFHKATRTLDELKRWHPNAKIEWGERSSRTDWAAFGHLEQYLFDNPRELPDAPAVERIEIVSTAGQRAEIEILARRVKELLVVGDRDAASGNGKVIKSTRAVRAAEIAIVVRSLEGTAPLVQEVFEEYGVPVSIDWRPRLAQAPILRALVGILQMQAGDWPYRQLLAVISNNFFQPKWPEWQTTAQADTEWAVRQLQIARGRRALLSAIVYRSEAEQPRREATADGDPVDVADAQRQEEHRRRFRSAANALTRLAKALPSTERRHGLSQWIGILDGLVSELRLNELTSFATNISSQNPSSDEHAWQACKDSLAAAVQLDAQLGELPLSLSECIARLQDMTSIEPQRVASDDVGRVRVLSAASVRALEIPYLFVAGLSEKAFPRPTGDRRIFTDAEYQRLNRSSELSFPTQHDHACDEMLLFYEVVTRATRQLVLSYPGLDEAAQPLSP